MNRNQLKLLACLFMLIDHIGYLLFPHLLEFTVCGVELPLLRCVGRLAFPLFAFFIGEGAHYTRNRRKYILQVLCLGLGCQAVYFAEELISDGRITLNSDCWYLNILITFAVAIGLSFLLSKAREKKNAKAISAFVISFIAVCLFVFVSWILRRKDITSLYLDYGISGIMIPLAVSVFSKKKSKTIAFSLTTLAYCIIFSADTPYVWFALLTIPLIILYNGKAGSRRGKYFFYVFYPAHLAILYLIQLAM